MASDYSKHIRSLQALYENNEQSNVEHAAHQNLVQNHLHALQERTEGRGSEEQVERTLAELKQSVMKSYPQGSELVKDLEDTFVGSPLLNEALQEATTSHAQMPGIINLKNFRTPVTTSKSGDSGDGDVTSPDVLPDLRPVHSIGSVSNARTSTPMKAPPASTKDGACANTASISIASPQTSQVCNKILYI
jgi:HPt (histidine-containing phosphotransfer) domain-containing protein